MWTGNEFEIEIVLIRHGRTKSNEERRYLSFTDEKLSLLGREEITGKVSQYPPVQKVYTSSLQRCKETAQIIYPQIEKTEKSLFDEINFGHFEGKCYQELKDNFEYQDWLDNNCQSTIPGGENRKDFICRQIKGLKEVLSECQKLKCVGIVTHGGSIMSIFSTYCHDDYFNYMVANGEYKSCHIRYSVLENGDVNISSFCPAFGDAT